MATAGPNKDQDAISLYLEKLPYTARLDYYQLTKNEVSLLRAMCSCTANGAAQTVWLDVPELARRAKISIKTAQRTIHGYVDRSGEKHQGLKARGILTKIAEEKRGHRVPATWRVNWDAFTVDPQWVPVIENRLQLTLPGIKRPAVPGEEIPASEKTAASAQATSVNVTHLMRQNDAPHASPRRMTCVNLTDRVLDLSSRSNIELSNRTAGHEHRGVIELAPSQQLASPPQKAVSRKSSFEKLPQSLQNKVVTNLQTLQATREGQNFADERTPEDIAGECRHLVLIACDRAGVWPAVAQMIGREEYQTVLIDERSRRKKDFDA